MNPELFVIRVTISVRTNRIVSASIHTRTLTSFSSSFSSSFGTDVSTTQECPSAVSGPETVDTKAVASNRGKRPTIASWLTSNRFMKSAMGLLKPLA
jgi:hypothetical protein